MRLLCCDPQRFEHKKDGDNKHYAILSHTWDEDELSFESAEAMIRAGEELTHHKVRFCSDRAIAGRLNYIWIDSCCIDKRNNNELQESINRMYQYYAQADVCYVYMTDVTTIADFKKSKWHTCGWTLQELLAPKNVQFYGTDGYLGDRTSLRAEILAASGVEVGASTIPQRFGWSLRRQTTKPEDASYAMLGLLEVTMLINYGEGFEAARERLLETVGHEHGQKVIREIRGIIASTPDVDWLQQLEFPGMNSRRANISKPFKTTCDWLLQHPDYQGWQHRTVPFLSIKGKPGAGKSTLIRFADTDCDTDCLRLTFYFNARGGYLEQTAEGLYRALLAQLIYETKLEQHLHDLLGNKARPLSIPEMQQLLELAVKNLTKSVRCYIDALDECTQTELQHLVHFLCDLSEASATPFSICFASRYFPSVVIRNSTSLPMESQLEHDEAIAKYVRERLEVERNTNGNDLMDQVIAKANQVFLWVVLVVNLLNKELSDGSIFLLKQRLQELPSELSQLMAEIMQQGSSLQIFKASIQWLLFAGKALEPTEYYLAVTAHLATAEYYVNGRIETDECHTKQLTSESLLRFISSSSRGFAEVVDEKSSHSFNRNSVATNRIHAGLRVQLIHTTVRDFFLDHGGLQQIFPDVTTSWIHNDIRRTCQHYLSRMECCEMHACCIEQYAQSHLVNHANMAATHVRQDDFISFYHGFSYENCSQPWSQFSDIREYVEKNALELIQDYHRMGFDLNEPQYDPPLIRAIECASDAVIQALVDYGANVNCRNLWAQTPLLKLLSFRRPEAEIMPILISLFRNGADPFAQDYQGLAPSDQTEFPRVRGLLSSLCSLDTEHSVRRASSEASDATQLGDPLVVQLLESATGRHYEATQALISSSATFRNYQPSFMHATDFLEDHHVAIMARSVEKVYNNMLDAAKTWGVNEVCTDKGWPSIRRAPDLNDEATSS